MRRVFYQMFLTLTICIHIPIIIIYLLHLRYTENYLESRIDDKLLNAIKISNVSRGHQREEFNDVMIHYIDLDIRGSYKNPILKLIREKGNVRIEKIPVGKCILSKLNISQITNHYFIVKKLSSSEIIIATTEMIKVETIENIISDLYKYYLMLIIPIIIVVSYCISRYLSRPIEVLERISTKMSNLDFNEKVEINRKNELLTVANNINEMAMRLKNNIIELNKKNKILKKELMEKKRNSEKEKMVLRAIGHELKTPIAIINGYLEALQDGLIAEDEVKNIYSILYHQGEGINKLIGEINYFLSLGRKDIELQIEELSLREFISKNLEKYNLDFEQKKIDLEIDCKIEKISTDIKCFNIIFNNILTNAITYVDKRAMIKILCKDDWIKVINSSDKLEADVLEKVFEPFYKSDSSRNRKYGGSGLGMAIIKALVEILKLECSFDYDEKEGVAIFEIKKLKNT